MGGDRMEKLVLVHLSDIHFSSTSGNVHDVDQNVRDELLRDVAGLTKQLGSAAGVLVTGDIAFSGKKEEYQHAATWLRKVCDAVGCEEQNVSVVPGNHDVDRKLASDLITTMLHQNIRGLDGSAIDSKLQEFFSNAQSANALLAPLMEYNAFAQRFGCAVSAKDPYWQRDLVLSCGTTIRMRGLCSAYVSNADDDKGKMILGTAYAGVQRDNKVLHLTLCHHPPEWLRDQDSVEDHLKSKVHIQLFGHKHAQRVDQINDKVRLVAGAMHPERRELAWVPTYNVLEIKRRDSEHIGLRLYQRRWHQPDTSFIADRDPNNGKEYREFKWGGYPLSNPPNQQPIARTVTQMGQDAAPSVVVVTVPTTNAESTTESANKHRLTFRFLTLPTLDRYEIALKLGLLREGDDAQPPNTLFLEVFQRAVDAQHIAELWDETERRHNDPAHTNPFRNSKPQE
jgi:predicted phosphodiesterase